jgi:hypothetical protein
MNKLLYLALGAVGLLIVIGGLGSAAGTALLPIAAGAAVVGLLAGKSKRHSGSLLIVAVLGLFLLFGLALKTGMLH